jgi:DNA polymerase sigma
MVQKDTEFWREMFQHESMVISLLNGAYLLLRSKEKGTKVNFTWQLCIKRPSITVSRECTGNEVAVIKYKELSPQE